MPVRLFFWCLPTDGGYLESFGNSPESAFNNAMAQAILLHDEALACQNEDVDFAEEVPRGRCYEVTAEADFFRNVVAARLVGNHQCEQLLAYLDSIQARTGNAAEVVGV